MLFVLICGVGSKVHFLLIICIYIWRSFRLGIIWYGHSSMQIAYEDIKLKIYLKAKTSRYTFINSEDKRPRDYAYAKCMHAWKQPTTSSANRIKPSTICLS